MFGQIWTEVAQCLFGKRNSFTRHLVQRLCHRMYVMKDQAVGDKMVILDALLPFDPVVLGAPSIAERHPLRELIEALALVHRSLDDTAQFEVIDVVEQEIRADDSSEFAKRLVQPIVPAVGAEPAKDGRRQQFSALIEIATRSIRLIEGPSPPIRYPPLRN
jgi:hypothetical protein